jgi:uroporphyrinogen-III decarboxylase
MDVRENFLRSAEMTGPEWIPCNILAAQPLWHKYREQMEEIVCRYPSFFGEYVKGSRNFDDFGDRFKGNKITDEWGCVWSFRIDGLHGQVTKHPLEDWKLLDSYVPPDPVLPNHVPKEGVAPVKDSFNKAKVKVETINSHGKLAVGGCGHGFMFQRLYYLRGFSNLMKDFIRQPPELNRLIGMVVGFNAKKINKWLSAGIDLLNCGDDLGMQDRLTIRPDLLRKYLIPAYSTMFAPARERGVHVRFHSDGHIMAVAEDLIKAGVTILNLQDLVNGVENIRRRLMGKVCIDIDIDRQKVIPFGTPKEVKKHVKNVVSKINSPDGGFMITVGIYPPTPIENIEALCQTLEDLGAGPKY